MTQLGTRLRSQVTRNSNLLYVSQQFLRTKSKSKNKSSMKIAIEGCCHGELDAIYASLSRLESQHSQKVDLLLIGGDFQVGPISSALG